jgi:putative oxygen-independent coproporphyrinogen III oxidase
LLHHLYIHIPFCHRICPYCSFHKHTPGGYDLPAFFRALLGEARRAAEHYDLDLRTVYFGGGTPTLPSRRVLEEFLAEFRTTFDFRRIEEFTFEANPRTFDAEKIRMLRDHGVTRVSLGVQAWDKPTLATLGRDHSPDEAREAFGLLRDAGLPSVNLDLMFSIPGQSLETWSSALAETIALAPDHISAYNLNYEEDTEFFDRLERGEFRTDDDASAEFFLVANESLSNAGFTHYEVSNYARPGFESLHNQAYWEGADYLGLGPGAFSTIAGRRWKNVADTAAYTLRSAIGASLECDVENLSRDELRRERIALLLRTTTGVSLDVLGSASERIPQLVTAGLAFPPSANRLVLTPRGRLIADSVAVELW